ncbi:hypothetical protein H0W80_00405 [Candidatus Saccharibacteria bacterium]|nr:hypothetical protein [Candidatus Saccharibacteria bacterium]
MLFAEISFGFGELAVLIIGSAIFIISLVVDEDVDIFIGSVIIIASLWMGSARGPTLRAQDQLQAQGITPVVVNVDKHTAIVKYRGCTGQFTLNEYSDFFQVGKVQDKTFTPIQSLPDPTYFFCDPPDTTTLAPTTSLYIPPH